MRIQTWTQPLFKQLIWDFYKLPLMVWEALEGDKNYRLVYPAWDLGFGLDHDIRVMPLRSGSNLSQQQIKEFWSSVSSHRAFRNFVPLPLWTVSLTRALVILDRNGINSGCSACCRALNLWYSVLVRKLTATIWDNFLPSSFFSFLTIRAMSSHVSIFPWAARKLRTKDEFQLWQLCSHHSLDFYVPVSVLHSSDFLLLLNIFLALIFFKFMLLHYTNSTGIHSSWIKIIMIHAK